MSNSIFLRQYADLEALSHRFNILWALPFFNLSSLWRKNTLELELRHIKELKTPTQHSWQSRVLGWEKWSPLSRFNWLFSATDIKSIPYFERATPLEKLISKLLVSIFFSTFTIFGRPSCFSAVPPSRGIWRRSAHHQWLLMLTVTRTKVRSRNTNSSLTPGPSTDQWQNGRKGFCVGQTLSGHVRAIPGLDPAALAPGVQCICCP